MIKVMRHFICKAPGCGADTPFDLKAVSKPGENYIICSKCNKKWHTTVMPSCCRIDVLFVSEEKSNKKTISTVQSFPRGT